MTVKEMGPASATGQVFSFRCYVTHLTCVSQGHGECSSRNTSHPVSLGSPDDLFKILRQAVRGSCKMERTSRGRNCAAGLAAAQISPVPGHASFLLRRFSVYHRARETLRTNGDNDMGFKRRYDASRTAIAFRQESATLLRRIASILEDEKEKATGAAKVRIDRVVVALDLVSTIGAIEMRLASASVW